MTNGLLTRLKETQEFRADCGEILPLFGVSEFAANGLFLVGLGPSSEFGRAQAFRAFGAGARQAAQKKRKQIGLFLESNVSAEITEAIISGCLVGSLGQDLYRAEKTTHPFEKVLCGFKNIDAIRAGQIIGESVNLARNLVNEPADTIYPFSFAERARRSPVEIGMDFELWDQGRMQTEECFSLLAVAKGADRLPCMTILRHQGAPSKDDLWLALVGKGVTFDSGGLSLKPSDNMKTMKCDMAGAATVLAAMQAISELRLPINVMGLMGLVENMPGAKAFKLGDVVKAKNGTTIEVHNTDAEGRMVLADVLAVAREKGADRIIDIATLTGACVIALGQDVTGLMANDQSLADDMLIAAQACGEPIWQLPMFSEYRQQIKSEVADIKNIGDGRWGGAITAAKFLEEFVGDTPWVHLDIAGPAFGGKPKSWIDAGATGVMVRSIVEFARNWQT